jgi:hypothetical protein
VSHCHGEHYDFSHILTGTLELIHQGAWRTFRAPERDGGTPVMGPERNIKNIRESSLLGGNNGMIAFVTKVRPSYALCGAQLQLPRIKCLQDNV